MKTVPQLSRLMYKIGTHRGPCGKVHGPKSVNKIGNSAIHAADVSLAHTIFRDCSKTLIKIDHFVTQATSAFNGKCTGGHMRLTSWRQNYLF